MNKLKQIKMCLKTGRGRGENPIYLREIAVQGTDEYLIRMMVQH